jgi:hypothetical protein
MSKIRKIRTDDDVIFYLSGERLLIQYIETFLIKTPFECSLTNHFINCSIAKNQKKIDACKCLLEDISHSDKLFQAVDALASQTELELKFPHSFETHLQEQTPEFHWLYRRILFV